MLRRERRSAHANRHYLPSTTPPKIASSKESLEKITKDHKEACAKDNAYAIAFAKFLEDEANGKAEAEEQAENEEDPEEVQRQQQRLVEACHSSGLTLTQTQALMSLGMVISPLAQAVMGQSTDVPPDYPEDFLDAEPVPPQPIERQLLGAWRERQARSAENSTEGELEGRRGRSRSPLPSSKDRVRAASR